MSAGRESEPYFFLSYAHTPRLRPDDPSDPDRWVCQLFEDLCRNILDLTDAHPRSVGFMDRVGGPGARWSEDLAQALATCRVFVPLYSKRYFGSEHCGREWFEFARRELTHRARSRQNSSAIVPAIWADIDEGSLPPVAKSINYDHDDLGRRYRTDGFYGLIKLKRFRKDYELAVYQLARRIVRVAEEVNLDIAEPADYHSLECAFGSSDGSVADGSELQITVLALDTTRLPQGRNKDYYGRTPGRWSPYRPDYSQPLAEYAGELATCFGCRPAIGTFDEHNAEWAVNGRPIPPGLCLVDAWATVSPEDQEKLRRFDELDQPWISVLVPWNTQDADMTAAERDLRRGLRQSLGQKLDGVPRRCEMAARGIPSLAEFGELMPRMATIMLKRFRKSKDVPTYPPEGPAEKRPRLRRADSADFGGAK